jgi:hypothetical protein
MCCSAQRLRDDIGWGECMHRTVLVAWLLGLLAAGPLLAQDAETQGSPDRVAPPDDPSAAVVGVAPCSPSPPSPVTDAASPEPSPLEIAWGLAGLRIFAAGPKIAPNGEEYHPSFSLDLDVNLWIWPSQGIYLFGDLRFWGERPESGVTNGRDGGLGFSKRQFDLVGGPAWNYAGPWEARVFGYTLSNLNRGLSLVTPDGGNDGFGVENRYYLSPEYARLGHAGFDIARADFVSVGYYPTKTMVGNDGDTFTPGLMLRAYLTCDITCDLLHWPTYAFADTTFLSERSMRPKLLLFDLGAATRPFRSCQHWEFRLGAENTADFEAHSVLNLWYVSLRCIF